MTDPVDLLGVVARRSDILETLRADPMERHVLVDHVDASKSTVYKGVRQLQERGLVESTAAGLQPTQLGIVALERYGTFARTADLAPLLAALPRGTIDPAALRGAEAVVPDSTDVQAHHDRLETILREASAIRGFSPGFAPAYVSIIYDRLLEDAIPLEFVFPTDLVAFLRRERPDALADVRAAPTATLYETDAAMAMTLLLAERAGGTQVCVELGEDAEATGLLLNDTEEARGWAERTFERVRDAADPIAAADSR